MQQFASTDTIARRLQAENKVLALIQMWADTFMMYEDAFPLFQSIYRQLRKEGMRVYLNI
jgi:hypothetical protein